MTLTYASIRHTVTKYLSKESIMTDEPTDTTDESTTDDAVVEDVLVEEVSIDGMCGVY
jgi:mycofactocin precursor